MADLLLSYIVPVFNTKTTLRFCVESLVNQGLREGCFEIILINDGSTDGSEELCHSLAERYLPIRVFSQKNMGLSVARNRGILEARGKYICLVDSDDSLIPGEIANLLSFCDGKTDLVRYWCKLVYPRSRGRDNPGDGRVSFSGLGQDYLRLYGLETFCSNYLYRKAFVEKNHLFFTPGIIGEDFPYMFDVMMANPQIVSVARQVYLYNINPDSISTTRSPEHSRRWVRDLIGSLTRIKGELEAFHESDPLLYISCHRSLEDKTRALFSRILSARYSTSEFRELLSSCKTTGLLPLSSKPSLAISLLSHFPCLYPLASMVFCRVFLPYIYPRINRNG